ncbi:5-formyltetrahydrofolate cyclo-ligase [Candidatus Omnitrophota bacterium]
MNIKEAKASLRKQCLDMLKAQTPDERRQRSEFIINKLLELEKLERISVVMVYVSDLHEVETHTLIEKLLQGGKRVVIPYLDESKDIIPCEINDLKRDTEMSWYGYLEPKQELHQKPLDLDELELVLVPGIAFDTKGNRLGRGWGCYDRFLSKLPVEIPTVGLAFDFQILPTIPTEENDITVSSVLSN